MKHLQIGTIPGDPERPLTIDPHSLIENRLLVQANSGGGKSNTIRLLTEKLSPIIPCIIIDPEGEFSTLREKVDMVIVGEGGELAATPKNAGALALKLLTLGVSAVIDLYALVPMERREFVRRYCENLIAAPKSLWRPFILFIDEAQEFAPEKAEAVSHGPLIEVMTKARKRDMCPILVTPRLAMLDADARGPVNNFMIGRATLDIDYKRAGEILGMPHAERRSLAGLKRGEFHTFGPSFGHDGVRLAHLARAETRPPKTGTALKAVPEPSAAIRRFIPELEALAQPTNPDAVETIDAARERIKAQAKEIAALRREAAKPKAAPPTPSDGKAIQRAVLAEQKRLSAICGECVRIVNRAEREVAVAQERASTAAANLKGVAAQVQAMIGNVMDGAPAPAPETRKPNPIMTENRTTHRNGVVRAAGTKAEGELPKGEAAILSALIQYPDGLRREQLTVLTGYKRSSRDAYLQRLRDKGLISQSGETILATEGGIASLPDAQPLPVGEDLQRHWMETLPEGESRILGVLINAYPNGVDREQISDITGYKRSSRDAYIQRMRAKQVIEIENGVIKASSQLFMA